MTELRIHTGMSIVITGIMGLVAGFALWAGAGILLLFSLACIFALWAAFALLINHPVRLLYLGWMQMIIFIVYALCFAWMTGGLYSPGILVLFLAPLTSAVYPDRRCFFVCSLCVAAGIAFFHFFGVHGPAILNLNAHRAVFLTILAAGTGILGFFVLMVWQSGLGQIKNLQQKLSRVSEDAKDALEVKDRFLANMSHEIRNPMNGIIGMMHVLLESDLDNEQRKHSTIVYNSAKALLSIVNDILDLSKIEAGKLDLDLRPFDLDIAIQDIVSLPELQARQKGIDFSYAIDASVPRLLNGDIGRIRQVLLNLIGNAIKFTEDGSVTLGISLLEDTADQARLKFSVDDTGIGIKPDVLEDLFSAFVQADASITREYGGTGLGLSISKFMVEKMGGTIGAESIEMIGSTFWCELVLEKQSPKDIPNESFSGLTGNVKLLVTGDDRELSPGLLSALTCGKMDYTHIESSAQVYDALAAAQEMNRPYHAVAMEVRESDLYARSLGETIKKEPALAHTRLILITAVGQKGDTRVFESLGFSAYLSMPMEPQILGECIRAIFGVPQDSESLPIITRFSLAERRKRKNKILIVDDMETNRITARALIERQGYLAQEAENGAIALGMIKHDTYDMILMDSQMPVMDGYEACRQIRDHERVHQLKRTPVVAMSGNAFEKDKKRCFDAGMDDFIAKPVDPDLLARLVYYHLNRQMDTARDAGDAESRATHAGSPDDGQALLVFDRDAFGDRFDNDRELMTVVIDSFFQEIPELLNRLDEAVANADEAAIQAVAHSIKGAAANVNAERLRQSAFELEKSAENGPVEGAESLAAGIKDEYNRFAGDASI